MTDRDHPLWWNEDETQFYPPYIYQDDGQGNIIAIGIVHDSDYKPIDNKYFVLMHQNDEPVFNLVCDPIILERIVSMINTMLDELL